MILTDRGRLRRNLGEHDRSPRNATAVGQYFAFDLDNTAHSADHASFGLQLLTRAGTGRKLERADAGYT